MGCPAHSLQKHPALGSDRAATLLHAQCDFIEDDSHFPWIHWGTEGDVTSVEKQMWIRESHNRARNCLILNGLYRECIQEDVLFFLQSTLRNTPNICQKPPPLCPRNQKVKRKKPENYSRMCSSQMHPPSVVLPLPASRRVASSGPCCPWKALNQITHMNFQTCAQI